MKMTFKYYPKLTPLQQSIIEELSYHTTKLYNIVNYDNRENGFKNYIETERLYKQNYHTQFLHSHTYQWCLKILEQNWKSYFASIKDYEKNPNKYLGKPKPPKFKNNKNKKNEVIFTKAGIRYKDGILKLSLSKIMKDKFQVQSLNFDMKNVKIPVNLSRIQQIRIQWDKSSKMWYLLIIWDKEVENKVTGNNVMAIDLGLDNLATCVFKDNEQCIIFSGKHLKSKNAYYNKKIARLTSIAMKQCNDSKNFKRTKKIIKLQKKRNDYIKDKLHKISKKIIELALTMNCNTIVIGDIRGIKQENYAKSFVQIPQQELVNKIKYKAELVGLKVVMINESYTSGCSAIDLEEINKANYNKSRRITRGLFKTNNGMLINADVNGALNILRKYIKGIPRAIQIARDNGCLNHPLRIRVV
ncbi:RNA-guided endonuclease InsQ/TnpB family protein [Parageobacillus galactosidasius]|uniref:Transposase n=1 Tax=Parageobacillus galactosidasius TaxID=883812 RepID=A0A226QT55_9BACL|nr:RNA-guided endonuclease TnpB family protein [Parageobacillus galactosidasius]OXB94682.1 transposase [Parageobacillus galactosidasius]